jgi:hypothetical protein
LLGAGVVMLAGAAALVHDLTIGGYLGIGVGLGIACGVVGSWVHDFLTAPFRRR